MPVQPSRADNHAFPAANLRATGPSTAPHGAPHDALLAAPPAAGAAPAPASAAAQAALAATPATRQAAAGAGGGATAAGFHTPDWAKDAIFYQVFPDRFANGDAGNDPEGTLPWGSTPTNDSFMGGDLQGVAQKMGYLGMLGVTGLYLNPIFTSPSNHKYNITDYEHVDPHFGGDAALRTLVDTAHANGVKVVLDGVFNHTSHEHPWFQDVRDNGPKSAHWNDYTVTNWPIHYERDAKGVLRSPDYQSWWNYATLPELSTTHANLRDYFLRGDNAIVKRWIRDYGIDGWRMDVADEIEHDFWKEARTQVKSVNPDAYLVAENWHDASDFLKGDEFDGAMNYQYFRQPVVDFFAKKQVSPDDFVQQLKNPYPKEAQLAMFNVLDSHDTARFVTEAGGDWYRQRPAAIFQMTYVGAPVIYYGDEIGMEGGGDPDSRRTFPWDKVPQTHPPRTVHPGLAVAPAVNGTPEVDRGEQLLDLYRTLVSVRKQQPALRRGDFQVLGTHDDNKTLSYRRHVDGAADVLVALNNDVTGHDVRVPTASFALDGASFTDALTGRRYLAKDGAITVPALDGNYGAVLVADAAQPPQR